MNNERGEFWAFSSTSNRPQPQQRDEVPGNTFFNELKNSAGGLSDWNRPAVDQDRFSQIRQDGVLEVTKTFPNYRFGEGSQNIGFVNPGIVRSEANTMAEMTPNIRGVIDDSFPRKVSMRDFNDTVPPSFTSSLIETNRSVRTNDLLLNNLSISTPMDQIAYRNAPQGPNSRVGSQTNDNKSNLIEHLKHILVSNSEIRKVFCDLYSGAPTQSEIGTVTSTYHENISQDDSANRLKSESSQLLYERRNRISDHSISDRVESMTSSQIPQNLMEMKLQERIDATRLRISSSKEKSPMRNKRSRSPSIHSRRSRSPGSKRMKSPLHMRSKSPIRRRSKSPVRRRSKSPVRRRSKSPVRRRSKSPVRRRSKSPIRRRSKSPIRRRSKSPIRRRSKSPIRLRRRILVRRSRSPILRRSRSPRRKSRSKSKDRASMTVTQLAKTIKQEKTRKQSNSATSTNVDPLSLGSDAHMTYGSPTPVDFSRNPFRPPWNVPPNRSMMPFMFQGPPWPMPWPRPMGPMDFMAPMVGPLPNRPPIPKNLVSVPLLTSATNSQTPVVKERFVTPVKVATEAPVKELPKLMQKALNRSMSTTSTLKTNQTVDKSNNENRKVFNQSSVGKDDENKALTKKSKSDDTNNIKLNLLNIDDSKSHKTGDSKSIKSIIFKPTKSDNSKKKKNSISKNRRKIRQFLRRKFIFDVCMYCGIRHVGKLDWLASKVYHTYDSKDEENASRKQYSDKRIECRGSMEVEVVSPDRNAILKNVEVVNISDDELQIGTEESDKNEAKVSKEAQARDKNEARVSKEGPARGASNKVKTSPKNSDNGMDDLEFQTVSDSEFDLTEEFEEDLADGFVVEEITSDDEIQNKGSSTEGEVTRMDKDEKPGKSVTKDVLQNINEEHSVDKILLNSEKAKNEEKEDEPFEELTGDDTEEIDEIFEDTEEVDEIFGDTEEVDEIFEDTEEVDGIVEDVAESEIDEEYDENDRLSEDEVAKEAVNNDDIAEEANKNDDIDGQAGENNEFVEEVGENNEFAGEMEDIVAEEAENQFNENFSDDDQEVEMENAGSYEPENYDGMIIDELIGSDIEEEFAEVAAGTEESASEALLLDSEIENEANIEQIEDAVVAVKALENINNIIDLVKEAEIMSVKQVATNVTEAKENVQEDCQNVEEAEENGQRASSGIAEQNVGITVDETEQKNEQNSEKCCSSNETEVEVINSELKMSTAEEPTDDDDDVVTVDLDAEQEETLQPSEEVSKVSSEDVDNSDSDIVELSQPTFSSCQCIIKSDLALNHLVAGCLGSAFKLLNSQLGIVNFAPYKSASMVSVCSKFMSKMISEFPAQVLCAMKPSTVSLTMEDVVENLQSCYQAVTSKSPEAAIEMFRHVLYGVPLMTVEKNRGLAKANMLIKICKNYLAYLVIDVKLKSLDKSAPESEKRTCELTAYKTHCQLQPVHQLIALRYAMSHFAKVGNNKTAATFAKRILKAKPSAEITEKIKLLLVKYESNTTDALQLAYDSEKSFVICAGSFQPIYHGEAEIQCPFCQANYFPKYKGILCSICCLGEVGRSNTGLKLAEEEEKKI